MTKEKPLSEKIYKQAPGSERLPNSLAVEDVKEAVEKLKYTFKSNITVVSKRLLLDSIDKIFGFTKEQEI